MCLQQRIQNIVQLRGMWTQPQRLPTCGALTAHRDEDFQTRRVTIRVLLQRNTARCIGERAGPSGAGEAAGTPHVSCGLNPAQEDICVCPGAQAGEAQKHLHTHQSRHSQVWRQEWGVQRGAWMNLVGKLNLGDSTQTLYYWRNMLVEKRIGFSFSGERRDVVYTYA